MFFCLIIRFTDNNINDIGDKRYDNNDSINKHNYVVNTTFNNRTYLLRN